VRIPTKDSRAIKDPLFLDFKKKGTALGGTQQKDQFALGGKAGEGRL